MKDAISELINRKRKKMMVYNKTPSNSWKKQLYRIELQILDNRIRLEQLKKQYR